MAGRLNISDHAGIQWLLDAVALNIPAEHFTPSYNVAELSALWGVTNHLGQPFATPMQWGFIPPWAKEGQFKRPLTIARAETIRERPSFRPLIGRYRGFIPVNGFYEWKRRGTQRDPYLIKPKSSPAAAIATICQVHSDGYQQCCVITTAATSPVENIYERQPLLIAKDDLIDWLKNDKTTIIDKLMRPIEQPDLAVEAIGDFVNDVQNDGPQCVEPVTLGD